MRLPWTHARVTLGPAGRVRCEPGWSLGPDWSRRLRDCDLWLVWAGRGVMRLRDRAIALEPGVCLWMRPGGRYEAEQDPEDRLGVTFQHFDVRDAAGHPIHDEERLPPEVLCTPDLGYVDCVMERTRGLCGLLHGASPDAETAAEVAPALFRALLMDLDARSGPEAEPPRVPAGTERHHRQRVAEAAARISEAPESAPSVRNLAAEAGYSPDHFARIFRAVTGERPRAYRVRARIRRAEELLTESSLTVGQIAASLGYRDPSFFCRQFKRVTGRSPGQARRGA